MLKTVVQKISLKYLKVSVCLSRHNFVNNLKICFQQYFDDPTDLVFQVEQQQGKASRNSNVCI